MFSRIKSLFLFYILTSLICSNLAKFYNVEETESDERSSESEESSDEDFDQKSGEQNVRKNDYEQDDDMYNFFHSPNKFQSDIHKGYGDFFKDDKPWSYSKETTEQYSEEQSASDDDNRSNDSNERSLSNKMSQHRNNANNSKNKNKRDNDDDDDDDDDGSDCRIIKKDGSTCTVCFNEITGGKSERCSYSSKPKDVSYAYTHESNYNSKDAKEKPKNAESKLKRMKKPVKKYPSSIQDKLEREPVKEIMRFNKFPATNKKSLRKL